jgi:hypothetical protein
LVDATGRTRVTIGDEKDATFQTPQGRAVLEWKDGALAVSFSAGVTGWLQRRGDWAVVLSDLVQQGVVKEAGEGWTMELNAGDVLELRAGALTVEVRQATVRPGRLPFDARYLLYGLLALLAVGLILLSVAAPSEGIHPSWIIAPPDKPRPAKWGGGP